MRVHEIKVKQSFDFQDWQELARRANRFASEILLQSEEPEMQLDAKSVLGIMRLPLRKGTVLRIVTKGSDEEEALDAMCELLEA